jgi:hypothetical protein
LESTKKTIKSKHPYLLVLLVVGVVLLGALAGIALGALAGITLGALAGITLGALAGITLGTLAGITLGAFASLAIVTLGALASLALAIVALGALTSLALAIVALGALTSLARHTGIGSSQKSFKFLVLMFDVSVPCSIFLCKRSSKLEFVLLGSDTAQRKCGNNQYCELAKTEHLDICEEWSGWE